jgi:leucyl-tRNA synthetase
LERAPYYALTMFPYPSGDLHMGHAEIFTIHDALVRHLRMTGKAGAQPDRVGRVRAAGGERRPQPRRRPEGLDLRQHRGAAFDHRAARLLVRLGPVLHTCDPEYYRWTQWLFLELFDAGLAYRREALVNWDPVARRCSPTSRSSTAGRAFGYRGVERVPRTQWFFRITDYADELLDGLDAIDWPDRVKNSQRNWIGRSEGAEITFPPPTGADDGDPVVVYTTRPDTIFGATYFVFAPEHPLVAAGWPATPTTTRSSTRSRRSDVERAADERRVRPQARLPPELRRGQPGHRRGHPRLRRRLRPDGLRHRRDHGGARGRPARLRLRPPGGAAEIRVIIRPTGDGTCSTSSTPTR